MTNPLRAEILALLDEGMSQQKAADRLGVTKNTVAGIGARAGRCLPRNGAATTMLERLDALHARMDAVLAETVGIGRVPDTPKSPTAPKPDFRAQWHRGTR